MESNEQLAILVLAASIVAAFVAFFLLNPKVMRGGFAKKEKASIERIAEPVVDDVVPESSPGYRRRWRVMNISEAALFYELTKQFPDCHVFPKMRIADILETLHGEGYYKRRNKVLPKHIDFLLCDANFAPFLAIELNGNSHSRWDRQESDELKKEIFQEVGIPLEFLRVGENFAMEVERLKLKILP